MASYRKLAALAAASGIAVVVAVLLATCYFSIVYVDWQLRQAELDRQANAEPIFVAWCGTVSVFDYDPITNSVPIFKANCASCHKLTEARSTGPGLLNTGLVWGQDRAELAAYIQMGARQSVAANRPHSARVQALIAEFGTVMPPQPLSEADALALAELICQLQ